MKHQDIDPSNERFNLIRNSNGFEELMHVGARQDLERLKLELEYKDISNQATRNRQVWESVSYYIVPKREWDIEHCPLMPVDFS